MFDHIIELHAKLQKNREEAAAAHEYNNDPTKYKLRIASIAAMERKKERTREKHNGKRRSKTARIGMRLQRNPILVVVLAIVWFAFPHA
jgi:hypothetical protein